MFNYFTNCLDSKIINNILCNYIQRNSHNSSKLNNNKYHNYNNRNSNNNTNYLLK